MQGKYVRYFIRLYNAVIAIIERINDAAIVASTVLPETTNAVRADSIPATAIARVLPSKVCCCYSDLIHDAVAFGIPRHSPVSEKLFFFFFSFP